MDPLPNNDAPPSLVILCTWPYATAAHVRRYVDGYQMLYPKAKTSVLSATAQVLPSQGDGRGWQGRVREVLETLISEFCPSRQKQGQGQQQQQQPWHWDEKHNTAPSSPSQPGILLHVFGNAGGLQAARLLRLYRAATGETLNIGTVILDTEPALGLRLRDLCRGRGSGYKPSSAQEQAEWCDERSLNSSYNSGINTLYFLFLSFLDLVHGFLDAVFLLANTFLAFVCAVLTDDELSEQVRRDLNNVHVLREQARRCYILPGDGLVFSWGKEDGGGKEDNGSGDGQVARREWTVERDKLDRGGGRWSGDEERYWEAIEEAWKGGVR